MNTALTQAVRETCHRISNRPSDRDLLKAHGRGESAAFGTLIDRHAPMVFGVARRVTGNAADAEDVTQAVFLLLFRKAGQAGWRESVAGWLHRVSRRVALRAVRDRARRRRREAVASRPVSVSGSCPALREVAAVIDDEIGRLPERLKSPVVLCHLLELTRDEAARSLGWSLRTLDRRLREGRELLRARLRGRGVELPAAGLAGLITAEAASGLTSRILAGLAKPPAEVARLLPATGIPSPWVCVAAVLTVGVAVATWAAARPGDTPPAAVSEPGPTAEAEPADPLPEGAVCRLGTRRLSHTSGVTGLAFLPDGRLAAGDRHGNLILWDLKTGLPAGTFGWPEKPGEEHSGSLHNWAFSPDGKLAVVRHQVTGNPPRVPLHVLDTATGEVIHVIDSVPGTGTAEPVISEHGVAVMEQDNSVGLWNPHTGERLGTFRPQGFEFNHWSDIALSRDGKTLAAVDDQNGVHVWDTRSGEWLRRLTPKVKPDRHIFSIDLSPDGGEIAVGTHESMTLMSTATGEVNAAIPVDGGQFNDAFYSPDGRVLAVNMSTISLGPPTRHGILVFDRLKKTKRLLSEDWGDWTLTMCFSADGKRLVSAGNRVQVWDLAAGQPTLTGFENDSKGATAFSPDGGRILTRSSFRSSLWDVKTGRLLRHFPSPALGLSPDGTTVRGAYLKDDPEYRVWDADTGRPMESRPLDWARIGTVSADGTRSARFDAENNEVVVTDLTDGSTLGRVTAGGKWGLYGLYISPDGRSVGWHGYDRFLNLWRVGERQPLRQPCDLQGLTFSPDGRRAAWCEYTEDGQRCRIWDLAEDRLVREFELPRGRRGWQMAFSPDGRTIALGGSQITLWETATGGLRRELPPAPGSDGAPAFSPDGRHLFTGGTTGLIWDLVGDPEWPADPASLRDVLRSEDAELADGAIRTLIANPDRALPWLGGWLNLGKAVDGKSVQGLIDRLDAPGFRDREEATAELSRLGPRVLPFLRDHLAGEISPETRRRAEATVARLSFGKLQRGRVLEALGRIDSEPAKRLANGITSVFGKE